MKHDRRWDMPAKAPLARKKDRACVYEIAIIHVCINVHAYEI